jgi:hypothetical protein
LFLEVAFDIRELFLTVHTDMALLTAEVARHKYSTIVLPLVQPLKYVFIDLIGFWVLYSSSGDEALFIKGQHLSEAS